MSVHACAHGRADQAVIASASIPAAHRSAQHRPNEVCRHTHVQECAGLATGVGQGVLEVAANPISGVSQAMSATFEG